METKSLVLVTAATSVSKDGAAVLSDVGKEEAAFIADGLCAYLELPSNFMPRGCAEPVAVQILHAGTESAAQTAGAIEAALVAAKCEVDCTAAKDALAADADAAALQALLEGSTAKLTVAIGQLPVLSTCATQLGVTISAGAFSPAAGVLLETLGEAGWTLAHHIVPPSEKKSWWIHGVSVHVRADMTEDLA